MSHLEQIPRRHWIVQSIAILRWCWILQLLIHSLLSIWIKKSFDWDFKTSFGNWPHFIQTHWSSMSSTLSRFRKLKHQDWQQRNSQGIIYSFKRTGYGSKTVQSLWCFTNVFITCNPNALILKCRHWDYQWICLFARQWNNRYRLKEHSRENQCGL